jgi:hypothetical protein
MDWIKQRVSVIGTCSIHERGYVRVLLFQSGDVKERGHMGNVDAGRSIALK